MLSCLLSAVALASAVSAFAGPQNLKVRDDLDFAIELVETIECTPLAGAVGTLVMKSTPQSPIRLPEEGVPLGFGADGTLEEVDQATDHFIFENCTSSFMELTPLPGEGVYYGHLTLASDPSICVNSYPGQPTKQPINTDSCSISDDSGQMLLFWKLSFNVQDPTAPAQLDFVGKSARLTNDPSYHTTDFGPLGLFSKRSALINYVNSVNPPTYYQISLTPSSQ